MNKVDGLENEALAGSGFAREHVHALSELQLHVVNERKTAYAQIFQHNTTRKKVDRTAPDKNIFR